jgi:NADP-dependent 3-hydroxy acid dehydrogenase YdfG
MRARTDIDGAVVLVTGAASGIGRALSARLAARGASVVMSDIDRTALDHAAAAVAGAPCALTLDVRDAEAFATVVDRVLEEHGRLDILINNAGTAVVGEAHERRLEHWRRVLDVNLHGVVNGVVAVYPGMVTRRCGHIVNVASLAGLMPVPLFTAYAASKAAVVGLSLSLRTEAETHGVRVTAVCPGVIETPLLDRASPNGLEPVATAPDVRAFLTRTMGTPYPAQDLARDVICAVERNQALLVAPGRARLAWRMSRLSPSATLNYATRTLRRHQQREVPVDREHVAVGYHPVRTGKERGAGALRRPRGGGYVDP